MFTTPSKSDKKKDSPVFFYHQSGLDEGPFFHWQLQEMLRHGIIHADAQIRQGDGTFLSVEEFVRKFGCVTADENLPLLEQMLELQRKQVHWARVAGITLWIAFVLFMLFGVQFYIR